MILTIATCLATFTTVYGGIYVPKQGSLLTPGVKDYGVPVKLYKITNTLAVPFPYSYPIHVATRHVPFPLTVQKHVAFTLPQSAPIDIMNKQVRQTQPGEVAVPKPVTGSKSQLYDGILTPPPVATSNQDYLAYTLFAPAKSETDKVENADPLAQRQPATFDNGSSGTGDGYTAPPDVDNQEEVEDGPSRDIQPPPEFQPPHSSEFGYTSDGSAEYETSRDVEEEDSYASALNSRESEEGSNSSNRS